MADAHNIQEEVKKYYKVFGALMVLTVLTVAVANLKVGVAMAVFIALVIATTKATLVASFFMHLISEKRWIYIVLGFTMFFFASMIFLIILGKYSKPQGSSQSYYAPDKTTVSTHDSHKGAKEGESHSAGGHH